MNKMILKRTLIFFSIAIVIAFCYLKFFAIPYTDLQWKTNHKTFNEANIAGRIENIGIKNHGTSFKVQNALIEYVFYPYTNKQLNDSKVFGDLAEKGDSIIKPAFSDILVLIKKNKAYEYNFKKK